jgi:hypothetical protein
MVTPKQIEVALHKWKPWNDSINEARQILSFRPNFTHDELKSWEKATGWEKVWQVAQKVLQDLVLPPSFASYWVGCFNSDYDAKHPATYHRIRLPQRARAGAVPERLQGACLIGFAGTKAYKFDKSGRVTIDTSKDVRVLPPFPIQVGIPCIGPIGCWGFVKNTREVSEAMPIVTPSPFAVTGISFPASATPPSPYITVHIPLFAPEPDWTWLRKQLGALRQWLKMVGEHPLQTALKGERRERFYWKEQAIEKLINASDKKQALKEIEDLELAREGISGADMEKAKQIQDDDMRKSEMAKMRKIKTRVRKRVAVWAKEAGIL